MLSGDFFVLNSRDWCLRGFRPSNKCNRGASGLIQSTKTYLLPEDFQKIKTDFRWVAFGFHKGIYHVLRRDVMPSV